MRFAPRVCVFAFGNAIYHTHAADAVLLVRDGLAERCNKVRVDLIEQQPGGVKSSHGNPQKYTFVESVGSPVTGHCHSLKIHIANPKNWPFFRAAVVDCLPRDKQAEIRDIFKPKPVKRRAA